MTDWDRRTVEVPLAFLGRRRLGGDRLGRRTERRQGRDRLPAHGRATCSAAGTLRLDLAPGGGAVVRLRRR